VLFAIAVTGLAMTVSVTWLRGSFYAFLAILHAITVITGLLYLPFGKFFHIFQRPAQLGVKVYQDAGARGPAATCRRCGRAFASAMHVADLKVVLPQLGFDYAAPEQGWHWQDVCPACKRAALATAQQRVMRDRA
jgi:NNP family nitrate/nitrite transporter-like MFS transporter